LHQLKKKELGIFLQSLLKCNGYNVLHVLKPLAVPITGMLTNPRQTKLLESQQVKFITIFQYKILITSVQHDMLFTIT
jgi:hypothetical protein